MREDVEHPGGHLQPVNKPGHIIDRDVVKIDPFLSDVCKKELQAGAVRTECVACVPSVVKVLEVTDNRKNQLPVVVEDNVTGTSFTRLDLAQSHHSSSSTGINSPECSLLSLYLCHETKSINHYVTYAEIEGLITRQRRTKNGHVVLRRIL